MTNPKAITRSDAIRHVKNAAREAVAALDDPEMHKSHGPAALAACVYIILGRELGMSDTEIVARLQVMTTQTAHLFPEPKVH